MTSESNGYWKISNCGCMLVNLVDIKKWPNFVKNLFSTFKNVY